MLDYLIVLLVGAAAFLGEPWWIIILGAVTLALGPMIDMWGSLQDRKVLITAQVGGVFAATAGRAIIAAAASYVVGYVTKVTWL